MAKIKKTNNESIDRMLKRFKREVKNDGILEDYKKHQTYVKPSEAKKLKKKAGIIATRMSSHQRDIII